jgi:hypothetical protein
MVVLERQHFNELEVDALDLVWSLVGTGVHSLLDAHAEDEAVNEDDGPINGLDRTGVVFLIAADNNLPNLKTNINDTYIYIFKKKTIEEIKTN